MHDGGGIPRGAEPCPLGRPAERPAFEHPRRQLSKGAVLLLYLHSPLTARNYSSATLVSSVVTVSDASPGFDHSMAMGDQFGYSSLAVVPSLDSDGATGAVNLAAGAVGDGVYLPRPDSNPGLSSRCR